jgi:hypothetical protein
VKSVTPFLPTNEEPDLRQIVGGWMAGALEQVAAEVPTADAALILRLAIGYFAEVHARSFGHAATVKAVTAIARRGVQAAAEEMAAARH